jgi:molecular chaperone Hsp33
MSGPVTGGPRGTEPPRGGEVVIRRRFDRLHQAVLADGDFAAVFAAYNEHVERWELPLDPFLATLMRQGLAATALHLSARPHDETVGFTLNFKEPPTNLFITGDAAKNTFVGRAFEDGVATAESSRLYVQTFRPGQPVFQSLIDVEGLDVLAVFEQYYARSEQAPARFFELEGDRFLMVQTLPDADQDWLLSLDPARADEIDLSPDELLIHRNLRFQCGCSPARQLEMLRNIYKDNPGDLFKGDAGVETFCPRCGGRWWITEGEYGGEGPGMADGGEG